MLKVVKDKFFLFETTISVLFWQQVSWSDVHWYQTGCCIKSFFENKHFSAACGISLSRRLDAGWDWYPIYESQGDLEWSFWQLPFENPPDQFLLLTSYLCTSFIIYYVTRGREMKTDFFFISNRFSGSPTKIIELKIYLLPKNGISKNN